MRKGVVTLGKSVVAFILLFSSIFPVYWLVAMAIRSTDEMKGRISVIPVR